MKARSWSQFKTLVDSKSLTIQFLEHSGRYDLSVIDGSYQIRYPLAKNGGADQIDFETNYKVIANKKLESRDPDGASVVNPKLATQGRNYQSLFASSVLGKYAGIISKDISNADSGLFIQKIYDAEEIEITDSTNEGNAILTTIEWKPTHSYDIQGFCVYQANQPASDIFLNAIQAHNIPLELGGTKVVIQGYNLRLGPFGNRGVNWVGDSTTTVEYDPNYLSHESILKIYHPTNTSHEILIEIIWYV